MNVKAARWRKGGPAPSKGILLLRHGPRVDPDIPPLSAMLTPQGVSECLELGKEIKSVEPLAVYSSPAQRCVDTAGKIVEGASWGLNVIQSKMLGLPGPFRIEPNEELDKLIASGHKNNDWAFLHRHIAGEEVPGMRDRLEGANNFVNELFPSAGFVICISHDSIIAAVIAALGLDPRPWPKPLQGAFISREAD